MADLKFTANGNVSVWVVPVAGIADPNAPTAAEINAGVNLDNAIAWEGTTFPSSTDSDDVDDRSLNDKGNATSRGFAAFEATLNFFRPASTSDSTSDYGKAFQFFKTLRVPVYLVTRVAQRSATGVLTPAAAGQWISVYKFITTTFVDDTEGDDSYKYEVGFMPQGFVKTQTQVKNATPVTTVPATTLAMTVAGGPKVIRALMGGKRATHVVTWSSSDLSKATVSQNGVVTPVAAGTATITASHPAASASATVTVTVT
jgi:hypothetical protein